MGVVQVFQNDSRVGTTVLRSFGRFVTRYFVMRGVIVTRLTRGTTQMVFPCRGPFRGRVFGSNLVGRNACHHTFIVRGGHSPGFKGTTVIPHQFLNDNWGANVLGQKRGCIMGLLLVHRVGGDLVVCFLLQRQRVTTRR